MDAPGNRKAPPPSSDGGGLAGASLARRLLALAATFGKFGALTFGGGYAVVALLEEELVRKRRWMEADELLDMIAVGESTPGPIAVNVATFVGYRMAGVLGGIVATLALAFPPWLCIVLLSACYEAFRANAWIAAALSGVRMAAIVLVLRAAFRMGRGVRWSWHNAGVGVLAFGLAVCGRANVLWILLGGLLFGVLWHGGRRRRAEGGSAQ